MVAESLLIRGSSKYERVQRRSPNLSFTTKASIASKKNDIFIRRSTSCDELAMCRSNRARSPVLRAISPFCKEAVTKYATTVGSSRSSETRDSRKISPRRRARSRNSVPRERSYSNENRQVQKKPSQKKTDGSRCTCRECCSIEKRTPERKTSVKNVISFPTNSLLHSAVVEGDIELAQRLLLKDPSAINKLSLEGTAPIHEAAVNGDVECMQLLIKYGASLDVQDKHNRTPIEYAVLVGNFDCAALLLSYGASDEKIRDGVPFL